MTTSRSRGASRLVAGLATTGLLTAGLTCFTVPAHAATSDPLGFDVSALATTAAGGVIAVGSNWVDGAPHAALVEDGEIAPIAGLPGTGELTDVAVVDGTAAFAIGSDGDGEPDVWNIDLDPAGEDPLVAQSAGTPPGLERPTALAVDGVAETMVVAGTTYDSSAELTNAVLFWDEDIITLAESATPTDAAVTGTTSFVTGTDDDNADWLWIVQADGSVEPVEISEPTALAAADGVGYLAETDGTDSVIRAIDAAGDEVGVVDFADTDVNGLAVSADGETLYAAAGYDLYAIPTDGFADFDVDGADSIGSDEWLNSLVISEQGAAVTLFGEVDTYDEATDTWSSAIAGFGAPEKPVVAARIDPAAPTTLEFTVPGDVHGYHAKVTGPAGKVVFDGTLRTVGDIRECSYIPWEPDPSTCWIDGLDYGTTYTLVVTATNFLGSTTSEAKTVSTLPLLAGPSSARFTGTAQVGQTLTAVTSTGWAAGTALQYGWSVNGGQWGNFVPGTTLALTPDLVGTKVSLWVTGTKGGFAQRIAKSAEVVVQAAPAVQQPALKVTKKAKAKVAGTPKVGKVIKANVGTWPKGTKIKVQWYVNGKPIKGATKKKFKLKKKFKGKKISVVVTGVKKGYAPKSKKSKAVKVRGR